MGRLYVGNISYNATEDEIRNLLNPYGVKEIVFIKHKDGAFKGFCFADLENSEKAKELNDQDFKGRKLVINDAREKTADERPRRNFRNDNRGGGRNFGNRNDRGNDRGYRSR